MTKRIGILGANGQVGSEVSLLLHQMEGVQVVPICRNPVGATFLRRCGLDVRLGVVDTEKNSRELLADLDLVADFTLPAGSTSYVRAQIAKTIGNTVRFAPAQAPFVYLSSILAFGNPDVHSPLRSYRISHSAYGSTKRYAERLARRLSLRYKRPAYLFRTGVVHGELQSATRQVLKDLRASANLTAYVPDCESYTVFAFSIAEALISAANQKDRPGLYTLVSNPAWSWMDLHQYLCNRAGVDQATVLLEPRRGHAKGGKHSLKRFLFGALRSQKELLNGYIGASSPELEQKMRATYHMRNAAAEIRHGELKSRYLPYFENFSVYPGARLQGISDSRVTMSEPSRKLQEILSGILTARRAGQVAGSGREESYSALLGTSG